MWSYEKLHRSMAHLFLGQLVSTFDEEFRILFAQSKPLMIENMLLAMEEFNLSQKRQQYPSDRASLYKDSRRFLDAGHPEEWPRHSYDERMDVDWRMVALKKQESLHGPSEMYSRFPSQQPHMDPLFDQGPSRIAMTDNAASRRYGYADAGQGRFSYPFQQGVPEAESQRRQVPRGQQLYPGPGAGPEADYSGGEKFWNQDYHCVDQYFEPQEMQPPQNFDHVLSYLSSTQTADVEQSSDKLHPAADLPFSSSHQRRLSLGQTYACQTSPTHSNTPDEKLFFPEANVDRKNPMVKRGLRNWRISSYLSAYDDPEEEDLLSAPPQAPEPVEEPAPHTQQTAPATELPFPKIPNVREFKVHALPRASQIPGYAKITAREPPKKSPDEPAAVMAETKTTPTPSESSSTNEGEKVEEAEKEQREPKTSALRRDDSFRRKYNPATPRSSRLRSSLIFSSLEQQHPQDTKATPGQQDEESDLKNEEEQKKVPFALQVLGQRRSATREPTEWSRYMKSATSDNLASETSKPDDGISKSGVKESKEDLKVHPEKGDTQVTVKPPDVEQATVPVSVAQPKPPKAEPPKTKQPAQPLESFFTTPSYVDMNDPDVRLMFFKEMAAKRKAAKAAEAKKSNDESVKPTNAKQSPTVKMAKPETSEKMAEIPKADQIKYEARWTPSADQANSAADKTEEPKMRDASEKMTKPLSCDSLLDKNITEMVAEKTVSARGGITNSFNRDELSASISSETKGTRDSNETAKLSQSTKVEAAQVRPRDEPMLSKADAKEGSPSHPPTPPDATAAGDTSPLQGTDERQGPDSTSKDFTSPAPSSSEVSPATASVPLDSERPESVQSENVVLSPPLPSEQHTTSESASSNPSEVQSSPEVLSATTSVALDSKRPKLVQSENDVLSHLLPSEVQRPSNPILPASNSTISPSLPSSSSGLLTIPPETVLSNVPPDECSSPSTSIVLPLSSDNAQESDTPLQREALKSDEESSHTSLQMESAWVPPDTVASTETSVNIQHLESDLCHDTCAAGHASSSQSSTKPNFGESGASTPEKDLITSENNLDEKAVADEPQVPGPSEDVRADASPPSLIAPVAWPTLTDVSDNQTESMTPTSDQPDPQTEQSACQAVLPFLSDTDMNPDPSQSETIASPQDAPTQVAPPSELNLPDTPPPAEAFPCSPSPPESAASILLPGSENTEINISVAHSSFDTNPLNQEPTDSDETGTHPSKVPAQNEELCKSPGSKAPPSQPADAASDEQGEIKQGAEDREATDGISKVITRDAISGEQRNSCSEPAGDITAEEPVPLSPQSKQPKSNQSRYHSSTANVLSSSNLRDDTKLLLEQISANSQSRNEATKDLPVTDDEKEDEADKNAKREKARGIKPPGRGQPKLPQEREKVLERIQSMRKERRVYSRFQV